MSQKKDNGTTLEDPGLFKALIPKNMRLIGIDAGSKTLGLALSDTSLMIASALRTIRRSKFSHDAADLLNVADEHDVAGFVLGLPKNMDGTEGPRAQSARAFARNINTLNLRPILLWDNASQQLQPNAHFLKPTPAGRAAQKSSINSQPR